ncbi:hypothetical protein DW1_1852 [Proteiniborus sp. DW1]|uniref:DUF6115 domain-containing protein n=1 Tax=Proteiniborus sp. DW1 TaxID=1889883 RepID=UPI00092E1F3F|nr:hypothetical protein [Proteiniborus sp. DW1]SCG83420.1 hypothetical protein DW1_1852 [Proteiniborus sp. DW1]
MNAFILILGLLLIVIASIAIFSNDRKKAINLEEIELINDINETNSQPVEHTMNFEEMLNDINNIMSEDLTESTNSSLVFNRKDLTFIKENSNISDNHDNPKELIENNSKDNYDKIVELYKSGLRVEEIARITEKGIREVEIILKFHNKKSN